MFDLGIPAQSSVLVVNILINESLSNVPSLPRVRSPNVRWEGSSSFAKYVNNPSYNSVQEILVQSFPGRIFCIRSCVHLSSRSDMSMWNRDMRLNSQET
jgi:hypothetical protein